MTRASPQRSRALRGTLYCAVLACLFGTACSPSSDTATANDDKAADRVVILQGGNVHDGVSAGRMVDVAMAGDRILEVGANLAARHPNAEVIDVSGQIVAPGFIDPHTHPDTYIRAEDASKRRTAPWLHQGVTTIAIGVDGGGTPDIRGERTWFESNGVGVNLVQYVGVGGVRRKVLGDDARAPDASELDTMRGLVADAMCEGAFGLSSGLFYAPQSFATTSEVVALAREAATRGGIYDTHQRDESSYTIGLLSSIDEALEIGAQAGLPVHFAHIKALGVDTHGMSSKIVERIEAARAKGQRVTADQYPWLASGTDLASVLIPRWAQDGGRAAMLARFDDPKTRERIRKEMAENLRRRGGAQSLLLTARNLPWSGKRLNEVATMWSVDALDAALRVLRESDDAVHPGGGSGSRVASFNMDRGDVELLMQQPWVITSSDGGDGHPRQYASFPAKYVDYVSRNKVISLEEFIHRSTALTAQILGIDKRGQLQPGWHADVVVFDPDTYAPKADYLSPRELSVGVNHLFVNGKAAIVDGEMTDVFGGRVLRHMATPGTCKAK